MTIEQFFFESNYTDQWVKTTAIRGYNGVHGFSSDLTRVRGETV